MINPFSDLVAEAKADGLEFLLIGGHAVNAYGYERTTLDIDFLICADDLHAWKALLKRLGYIFGCETDAFAQFVEPDGSHLLPIDLMIVDSGTYQKLTANSNITKFGDVELALPRVLDLIALKLHALRSPTRAAKGKDLPDIIALMEREELDVSHPELSAILDRYATSETKSEITSRFPGK